MKWGWRHRENLVDGEWRWSFARRQLIYDVVEPERVYLERWRFDTPFVSIFLHSINLPDRDPYPHTHPFSWSRSLIVKGSYVEERGPYGDEVRKYRPGQVNRIDADTVHRIVSTRGDRPVWTIFAAGKPHAAAGASSSTGTIRTTGITSPYATPGRTLLGSRRRPAPLSHSGIRYDEAELHCRHRHCF